MSRFATPIRNQSFSTYSEKAHQPKIPVQNKPGYRICYNEAKGVSILGGSGHILEILKDGDLKTIKSSDKESPIEKTKVLKLSNTKIEREDRTKQLKPYIQSQIQSSSPKSLNTVHNGSLRNLLTEQTITGRTRSHSASSSRSYLSTTPSSEPLKYTPPSLGNNVTTPSSFSSSNERTRSLRQIFPSPDRFPSPWKYKLCITTPHTKDNYVIDNNISNNYRRSSNRKQLIRQSPPLSLPEVSCSAENNNIPIEETQDDLSHINVDEKISPSTKEYNYSPATTVNISMLSLDELADKITNSKLNKIFDEIVDVNNHNNNNSKEDIDKELLNTDTDIETTHHNNYNNILSQSTIIEHQYSAQIPHIAIEDFIYELTL